MKKGLIGLNRDNIDKFYTKKEVVNYCYELLKKLKIVDKNDLVIEPSAGNGSFIPFIKKLTNNYLFFDIEPENKEIIKQDFLKYNYKILKDKVHIIGNPPFGRQSSLAIKFINKCCKFADSISFILPKSFKKTSLKSKFPLNYHLILEKDIQNNAFLINTKEHNVPCVFQIWIKKDKDRKLVKKVSPKFFKFVKKRDIPDISVRRVGFNAGKIDKNIDNKNINTHYFIKLNDNVNKNIIHKLNKIKYKLNNTVGPRSISKRELIIQFNKVYSKCQKDGI